MSSSAEGSVYGNLCILFSIMSLFSTYHLNILAFLMVGFLPIHMAFLRGQVFFIYIYILKFLFYFHCFAGWGYIVAFTEVLKIYQIYHI
jgi:hypothetical protein